MFPNFILSNNPKQVFNSNGMCAVIHNVSVPEPPCQGGAEPKATKAKSSSKLHKFFSGLFKAKGGEKSKGNGVQHTKKVNSTQKI